MPGLYEITVPVFVRTLHNLDHIPSKAMDSDLDEKAVMGAQLAPDMLPLPRQVQITFDTVKLVVTRIAQAEPRSMSDEEESLAELRERIAKTVAYLEEPSRAAFDGREGAEIVLKFPNFERRFARTAGPRTRR